MKRFFGAFVVLCLTMVLLLGASLSTSAATSGRVGSCEWTLNGTVLTISGSGPLDVSSATAPWGQSITEVRINEGVTSISTGAFSDCRSLYKVTLPGSLRIIGHNAFSNCTALNTITLKKGLTTIESYAFLNCSSLLDITLPATVTYVGYEVFDECYSLNNIFVETGNPSYTSVGGVLYSKDMTVLVRYPLAKSSRSYAVPDGVKELSMGAFADVWSLLDITLPDTITKIGLDAFFGSSLYHDKSRISDGCLYLGNYLILAKDETMKTCTVREGTRLIADGAMVFTDCLQEVILPEGLLYIGENAFSWCDMLDTIYLPASVIDIGGSAFYECNKLDLVFYSGSEAARDKIIVGIQNESLADAYWKYNSCRNGKEHNFDSWVAIKNATCTEYGEDRLTCSVCGAVVTERIPALGHKYGQWSETKPATCVSTGEEERSCTRCQDVETRELEISGHVWSPWSEETEASCEDVGVQKRFCVLCQHPEARNTDPRGHSFGDPEVVKKPTLSKTGVERSVCERCGATEDTMLDKIDPVGYVIVACVIGVIALLAVVVVFVVIKKKKADSPQMQA